MSPPSIRCRRPTLRSSLTAGRASPAARSCGRGRSGPRAGRRARPGSTRARSRRGRQVLRELQRALDVVASGDVVAEAAATARAPLQDVGAKQPAREARPLGELEGLVEQRDRGRDARELVAADAEPEENVSAVDVRELGPLHELASAAPDRSRRGPARAPEAPRPRPPARARSAAEPDSSAAGATSRYAAIASSYSCAALRASARSSLPRSSRASVETPDARNAGSTPSFSASHAIVVSVGRVFPRSIWLMYSFENRSPASWVCVSPARRAESGRDHRDGYPKRRGIVTVSCMPLSVK